VTSGDLYEPGGGLESGYYRAPMEISTSFPVQLPLKRLRKTVKSSGDGRATFTVPMLIGSRQTKRAFRRPSIREQDSRSPGERRRNGQEEFREDKDLSPTKLRDALTVFKAP